MNALTFADKDLTETLSLAQPIIELPGGLPNQLKSAQGLVLGVMISVGFWVVVGVGVLAFFCL